MNTNTYLLTETTEPTKWEQALYAFLAEKHRRTGSMRTVQSYSRILNQFLGKGGKQGRRELPRPALDAITRTLSDCGKCLTTMDPGESLWQAGAGPNGVSQPTAYARFKLCLVAAGLPPTGFHILRHSA